VPGIRAGRKGKFLMSLRKRLERLEDGGYDPALIQRYIARYFEEGTEPEGDSQSAELARSMISAIHGMVASVPASDDGSLPGDPLAGLEVDYSEPDDSEAEEGQPDSGD